jgi:predicted DNA-binding transcriptional regulator AlpA
MSLFAQAYIIERYGLRLNMAQLADLLGVKRRTILNRISAGTFPIPTYLDGAMRYADHRDVAEHLDRCRAEASTASAGTAAGVLEHEAAAETKARHSRSANRGGGLPA